MKLYLKIAASAIGVLILSIPIAVLVTIWLTPLWTWIEATHGIESIGHSGPADWCFEAVYAIIGGLLELVCWLFWRRRLERFHSYRRPLPYGHGSVPSRARKQAESTVIQKQL